MSLSSSTGLQLACSGDIYGAGPTTPPIAVTCSSSTEQIVTIGGWLSAASDSLAGE